MILNKVSIKNYRQYRDVEFEFSKDPEKNFTIIKGNNGTGKTTLLNALSWCLYGKEIHDYGDDSSMSLCNNKAANLAEVGQTITVSVSMEFNDDGDIIEFSRSIKYTKNFDNLETDIFGSNFITTVTKDGKTDIYEHNTLLRDRRIPKKIENYFFFDGALLSEYFQDNTTKNIKDAVFELSQLNLVNNLSKNLPNVTKKYIFKQKQINPKLGQANDKIERYEKSIKNNEAKKIQLNQDIINAEREMKSLRNEMSRYNSEKVKADVKRDQELEKEIEDINKKLEKVESKRKSLILENYPYIKSYYSFINFLSYGDSARKKKFIPADFKLSFLKDLLEEGICICGADLKKDEAHRKAIEELIANTSPLTDKSEEITSILTKVEEGVLKDIRGFKEEYYELNNQLVDLNKEFDKKSLERNEISANLLTNPINEINRLESEYKKAEQKLSTAQRSIGRIDEEIKSDEKNLGTWRQQKTKEDGLEIQSKEYENKIQFCKEAEKIAKFTFDSLSKQMRDKIQDLTKEKFLKIIWKEDEFVDIRINDFYKVFVKNKLGQEERPGDLSDGEKLSLGLCFMSALHNISGFDLPIIMDTPLGNLDVDMRHNIAKFLPGFVENKQTILLVTGTEYTEDFKNTIQPNVGKEYVIDWNNSKDGKESKVVAVNG